MTENQIIFEVPSGLKLSRRLKNKQNIVKIQIKEEQKSISGSSTDISEDENTDNKIKSNPNQCKLSILHQPECKKNNQKCCSSTIPIQKKNEIKYKTEMCRNWMSCNYGPKCRYAHSINELNNKQDINSHYKSRNCKLFHENGQCSYGTRCHFVHENRTQADINTQSKVNFQHLLNHGLNRGQRLLLFQELTQENQKSDNNSYQFALFLK